MNKKTRFGLFLAPDTGGDGGGNADSSPTDQPGTGLFGAGIKIGTPASALLDNQIVDPPKADPDPTKNEEKKETKPEPKEEVKQPDPKKPKLAHERFAELEESRNKLQKEYEDHKANYEKERQAWEEEKKRLATPTIPEDFKKEYESIKAEKERMEKDFQAAIVQRQLQQEYMPKRNGYVERLTAIAQASGDDSILSAINRWDYDALAEFGESLTSASQKRDWNRAIDTIQGIDEEVAEKSKNMESAWDELQRKSQETIAAQQKERVQKHISLAENIYSKMTEAIPALKGAPEISNQARADMIALAGGEGNERFPAERILQLVGEHPILNHICTHQKSRIEELEKTLAEREATIKRLKPSFPDDHTETPDEDESVGTGLFKGGIVVNRSR